MDFLRNANATVVNVGQAAHASEVLATNANAQMSHFVATADAGTDAARASEALANNANAQLSNVMPEVTEAVNAGTNAAMAGEALANNANAQLSNVMPQVEEAVGAGRDAAMAGEALANNAKAQLSQVMPQVEEAVGAGRDAAMAGEALANDISAEIPRLTNLAERTAERAGDNTEQMADAASQLAEAGEILMGSLQLMALVGTGFLNLSRLIMIANQLGLLAPMRVSVKELNKTNEILHETMQNDREQQLYDVARGLGENKFPKNSDSYEAWFFFSKNNQTVHQLTNQGYWALNTLEDVFNVVYAFNAVLADAEKSAKGTMLQLLKERKSVIYFLDGKEARYRSWISHITFPSFCRNVHLIHPERAEYNITFDSVQTERGCQLTMEYISIRKIVSYGLTELIHCKMGFPRDIPPISPGHGGDYFGPRGVDGIMCVGNVCCKGSAVVFSKNEQCVWGEMGGGWRNDKLKLKYSHDLRDGALTVERTVVPAPPERDAADTTSTEGFNCEKTGTIVNRSDKDWKVSVFSNRGQIQTKDGSSPIDLYLLPGEFIQIKHKTVNAALSGSVEFTDYRGDVVRCPYGRLTFSNWTILRPTVTLEGDGPRGEMERVSRVACQQLRETIPNNYRNGELAESSNSSSMQSDWSYEDQSNCSDAVIAKYSCSHIGMVEVTSHLEGCDQQSQHRVIMANKAVYNIETGLRGSLLVDMNTSRCSDTKPLALKVKVTRCSEGSPAGRQLGLGHAKLHLEWHVVNEITGMIIVSSQKETFSDSAIQGIKDILMRDVGEKAVDRMSAHQAPSTIARKVRACLDGSPSSPGQCDTIVTNGIQVAHAVLLPAVDVWEAHEEFLKPATTDKEEDDQVREALVESLKMEAVAEFLRMKEKEALPATTDKDEDDQVREALAESLKLEAVAEFLRMKEKEALPATTDDEEDRQVREALAESLKMEALAELLRMKEKEALPTATDNEEDRQLLEALTESLMISAAPLT